MNTLDNVEERVMALLGASEMDDKQMNLIKVIVEQTNDRLLFLLDEKEVPKELEYILVEVSVIRFNRIGSEGLKTHKYGSESVGFSNDDFGAYLNDIYAYKKTKGQTGVLKFL